MGTRGGVSEAFARSRIDAQLRNLGWRFGVVDANVTLEGEYKTPEQKKKLKGKRPDYILYRSKSTQPLAVIEAKKPQGNLDTALVQSVDYAKAIGAQFAFASDSYVVKMSDTDGNVPTIDGEPIKRLLSEAMLIKLLDNIHLKTEDDTVIKSRSDLISIFRNAEKLLRKDGVDVGIGNIYEFCTIMFIKIMSETSNKIPNPYRWENLVKLRGDQLYAHYGETIRKFKELYTGIFREVQIKSPEVLERIIDSLDGIKLSGVGIDIKGEAYEHFLKRYSSQNKSVLGQHFTPRHITDMMALLLNPKVDEKIYDPFCGTGGMLLSCYKEMRRNVCTEKDINKLNEQCLYGNDITLGTSQIAKMNMVLVGDGHSNITRSDSLKLEIDGEYNGVITNIPFNLSEAGATRPVSVEAKNSNDSCVRHCLKAVMNGGRACIIVPENMAYDQAHRGIREFIAQNSKIEAVIRLPRHTFTSYTTARTCILWLSSIRQKKSSEFVYIEVENDGFSASTWREPIGGSDIPKILENKDDLSSAYEVRHLDDDYRFFNEKELSISEGEYSLGELLDVNSTKEPLEPNKEYNEPRLSSEDNTISVVRKRLGRNIKDSKKVMIEEGDLVIATLHTQKGKGLFAISDGEYIATSQIVAKIKTDLVSVEYLKLALQNILPKMKVSDLTGRETYKEKEILALRIPAEPPEFRNDMKKIEELEGKIAKIEEEIEAIKTKHEKLFTP